MDTIIIALALLAMGIHSVNTMSELEVSHTEFTCPEERPIGDVRPTENECIYI